MNTYIVKYFIIVTATVQWQPLELNVLLRLLKPVASDWERLAPILLRKELQHNVKDH